MLEFKRDIFNRLSSWLRKKDRRPILVRGARQVGKSFAIRTWAKSEFSAEEIFEINFEEKKSLHSIFKGDLDPQKILSDLSLASNYSPLKHKIIFFDEIQSCPEAIMALRYFYEKMPEIPIIAAGSLIEFVLKEISFPVGRVESVYMFPFTFAEFLGAINGESYTNKFIALNPFEEVVEPLHQELIKYLKLYYRIGGMPSVVRSYIETKDLPNVSLEQQNLLQAYRDDFAKYAKHSDWAVLTSVFNNLSRGVCRSKIKYVKLSSEYPSAKVKKALELLAHASLISKVNSTYSTNLPLIAGAKQEIFKLAFLDIGLLQQLSGFDWSKIEPDTELTKIQDGAFAEQFVAQELIATRPVNQRYSLHYWDRLAQGSSAEVDFIIEHEGKVIPLEVKSGNRGTLKSLEVYQGEVSPPYSIVVSQNNFSTNGQIKWIPLYQVGKLC